MGKFDYEAGGDLSTGGLWLAEEGTFHLNIVEMQEEPVDKNGNLIPNAAFRVACVVCDGTVAGQQDKTTDITFFRPKSTDKNEGAFAKKKIDRFLVAVGLATEQQIKDKAKLSIDLQDAVGSQFVAKLEFERDDNGQTKSKFLSLSFADIFHVDDPAVAGIPKNKDCLALLPPSQRLTGNQKPAAAAAKQSTKAPAKQSTPVAPLTQPAGVGAGAASTVLDDV